MDDFTPPGGLWAGIGAGVTGIVAGAFWLINRISGASVDRASDRAEINIIEVLRTERDTMQVRLEKAIEEKNQYFQQFIQSNSQVTLLTEKVNQLTETVAQQNGVIEELRQQVSRLSQAMESKQ